MITRKCTNFNRGRGWNEDGELERVGNARFADAVILLRDGLQLIGNARFKTEVEHFIST